MVKKKTFTKLVFIHEIGHNLGASHGDPGSIMQNTAINERFNTNSSRYGTGTFSYSYVHFGEKHKGIRAMMGRVDMPGSIVSYYLTDKENKRVKKHKTHDVVGRLIKVD